MIRVLILRDRSFSGFLSAIVLEIDGKQIAKVRRGGRAWFEVPRGEHTVVARMHGLRSHPIAVGADWGDSLRFECGCRGYGDTMHVWMRIVGFEYHDFR